MPSTIETGFLALIAQAMPDLTGIRHDLHRHPELMFDEHRTSEKIVEELARLGIAHHSGIGGLEPHTGTGVLAHLPPTVADPGPCIGLRADMDALPIVEQTAKPYASANAGVMHACGHDGHTTILLGAARVLSRLENRPNPVSFFFQPGEEGGAGAAKMIRDGVLEGEGGGGIGPRVERVYGLHGWPHLPLGVVATKPGPLLAATDEFIITVRGTQAHAAYPHFGVDPIVCAAQIVTALQTIASRRVGPLDSAVVTVASIHAGKARNVIPGSVELAGTTRVLTPETRELVKGDLYRIAEQTAAAHGCAAEVQWKVGYPITFNDPPESDRVLSIARAAFGGERVVVVDNPTMGGEDFSFYCEQRPACFYLLGLCPPGLTGGDVAHLHQPKFDFNDEAIPIGVEMMVRLALS